MPKLRHLLDFKVAYGVLALLLNLLHLVSHVFALLLGFFELFVEPVELELGLFLFKV